VVVAQGGCGVVCLTQAEFVENVLILSEFAASSIPLVIVLVGDEAESLASIQLDSRGLATFLKMPFWEIDDAVSLIRAHRETGALWQSLAYPVVWIVKRWLSSEPWPEQAAVEMPKISIETGSRPRFVSRLVQQEMWVIEERLSTIYSTWDGNIFWGYGKVGLLFCGGYQRFADSFMKEVDHELRVMRLINQYPLPEDRVLKFLSGVDIVLVVEGHTPLVEQQLNNLIVRSGIQVQVRSLPAAIKGRREEENEFLCGFLANPLALVSGQPLVDLGAFIGLK
jgi:TPP-dependent indolepyruvate ferredoxin oxidoreductase alpha subunit